MVSRRFMARSGGMARNYWGEARNLTLIKRITTLYYKCPRNLSSLLANFSRLISPLKFIPQAH